MASDDRRFSAVARLRRLAPAIPSHSISYTFPTWLLYSLPSSLGHIGSVVMPADMTAELDGEDERTDALTIVDDLDVGEEEIDFSDAIVELVEVTLFEESALDEELVEVNLLEESTLDEEEEDDDNLEVVVDEPISETVVLALEVL